MNRRDFRLEAIFHTDTGSCMSKLVEAICREESCDLSPEEVEARVEEMLKHGLLKRPTKGEDWIKVTESGWQLWATRDQEV